ncbi:hypothetical protein BC826DRAFT_1188482 [Russula brevipes]|nr:hypothetical protein BC826DRAFT_1188482 [Russula brevipes]
MAATASAPPPPPCPTNRHRWMVPGTISAMPVTALNDTVDGLDRAGDGRVQFLLPREGINLLLLLRTFARRSSHCGSPGFRRAPLGTTSPATRCALPRQQHRQSYPPMHHFRWFTVMATRDDAPRSQVMRERLGLHPGCQAGPTVQDNQPKVIRVRAGMHATIRVQQLPACVFT